MKFLSSFALAAALATSPALAQKEAPAAPAPAAAQIKISKAADKPVRALNAVVAAKDAAGYPAALAAAQAAAQTDEDRYAIIRAQLNHSLNVSDVPGQIAAVEAMLASPVTRPEDKPRLYRGLSGLYKNANNPDQQVATLEKLRALDPNNTDAIWELAEARVKQNKSAEAVMLAEQAIKTAKDAGQPVDVTWYRRALSLAYTAKLQPQSVKLARELFGASTVAKDRSNALLILRQYGNMDVQGKLDLFRLMRSAKALNDPINVLSFADALSLLHYPAEAQSVLNEAIAAGVVKSSDPQAAEILRSAGAKVAEDKAVLPGLATKAQGGADGRLAFQVANGYFGHADFTKAAELYRLAIQKGGADKENSKLRLGIALAMAGKNAEAEAAFKSVSGNRADLASYWLLWLANRG